MLRASLLSVQISQSKGRDKPHPMTSTLRCKVRPWLGAYPRMKGCTNASLGVIRFDGSRARHLSSRSMNDSRSLFSSSLSLTEWGGIRRCRRSRAGFVT